MFDLQLGSIRRKLIVRWQHLSRMKRCLAWINKTYFELWKKEQAIILGQEPCLQLTETIDASLV